MKKTRIIIALLLNSYFLFPQDNGHCFSKGKTNLDTKINLKIADQLKRITKLGTVEYGIGGGPKVEYTGHHVLFADINYEKNDFDIVKFRHRTVEAAFKKDDSTCTIKAFLVIEEHIGGGKYSSPELYESMENITPAQPIGLLAKKYKSCACTNETKNWLEGSSGTGSNDQEGNSVVSNKKSSNVDESKYKKADGPYEQKSGDGKIEITGEHKNQKQHGTWKFYDNNGKVLKMETYKEGVLEGPYENYNENGTPDEKGAYANGNKSGVWTKYDSDGSVKEEVTYKNGEYDGKTTSYVGGKKRYEWNYVNGKQDGEQKNYSDRGLYNLIESYTLKDGKKEGICKTYDETGSLHEEDFYKNGLRNGICIRYRDNSKVKAEEQNYIDGKKEGVYRHFDATGKMDRKGQYVKDEKDGRWEEYDGGKLSKVQNFKMGQKDGNQEWYTGGKLTKTEVWENGVKMN
jgi:antitoxin component YwqK of YwqJK toxin-antitoxin module